MEIHLFLGLLVGLSLYSVQSRPVENAFDAKMYLMQYNHMGQDDMTSAQLVTQDQFENAIRSFQRIANLTVNGKLDDDTMEMMNMPRCGMPDNMGHSNSARRKRYSAMQNTKWPINDLTWSMNSFSPDLQNTRITEVMRDALKLWSDVSQLTFTQTADQNTEADIVIDFNTGDHGDGNPFDGPGSVLAHAYFPIQSTRPTIAGDAHFDDDETYDFENAVGGIDLFQVAAHEFGHSLGLGHSDDTNALMYAFYRGYVPNFELRQDDIDGIQYLYGEDAGADDPTMAPFNPTDDTGGVACPSQVDTVARVNTGATYAFVGSQVYELSSNGVVDGFPRAISQVFNGLPNNIDASFYYSGNQRTYFFKGDQYWRSVGTTLEAGYPRNIAAWGLPADIDAAFVWSGNNRIYFTKGDQYYRYNTQSGTIDNGYPRPLSVWGIPADRLDSAIQFSNRRTYFFAGDSYYRFNDAQFQPDESYPRPTAYWWFGCGDSALQQGTTPTSKSMPASLPSGLALLLSATLALLHVF